MSVFATSAPVGVPKLPLPATYERQLSLYRESRNEPLNRFVPDFVITFTTPPLKRPYSAEIPDVDTVVS